MNMRPLVAAVAALTVLAFGPVQAYDETCSAANGSAATPHLEDGRGDWNGTITGNESGTAFGDINNSHNDVLAGWLNRDGNKVTATITLAELTGNEINEVVYFFWNHFSAATPERTRRWVATTFNGRTVTYNYGHRTVNPTTGQGTIVTEGTTTGSIVAGSPGSITMNVPMSKMGNPVIGDELGDPVAESRFYAGVPGVYGQLYTIDNTRDGDGCTEITY